MHRPPVASLALTLLAISLIRSPALAAPTIGFMEHWNSALDGWGGGATYGNPGTGGVRGAGDGYLRFSTPGPPPQSFTNLGAQSAGPEYAGNWQAAGVTQVRFWLNDVGNADPLEMHFAIGNSGLGNFWQYNTGFIPAHNAWTPFVVDLTSAAAFTQIIADAGTFNDALQNVNRILIRHDLAPYTQSPDAIVADVGLDELLLTDGVAGVGPDAPGVPHPLAMAPPYPNPSRGPVALAIDTFEDAAITIQVVDVMGRVIRHAALAPAGAGLRLWTWDGRTDAGATAAAGVYRVRAFGPSGGVSRSLVRVGATR
jgi:hypothetical protein